MHTLHLVLFLVALAALTYWLNHEEIITIQRCATATHPQIITVCERNILWTKI